MKPVLALAVVLALAGCATVPASVHTIAGKALIDAESGLDAAVLAATHVIAAGVVSAPAKAKIAALTAPCPLGPVTQSVVPLCPVEGSLTLAREAYAATDTTSFPQLTANLLNLAQQLANTHP